MQLTDQQKKDLSSLDSRIIIEVLDGYIDEIKDDALEGTVNIDAARTAIEKLKEFKTKFGNQSRTKGKEQFV